ncbi:DUF4238 domain-containing protein [Rhizobium sp. P44RR-XXIV]|uniref:DUF4238 domain-containing protein n=1 Tax=Rhizobium sp. P44RR-XXIV TaxID=1921145 RepID=UPI0009866B27|nr:DUF4238 domain-containing protein [Rhizobium sp. P44RR-XXIV]TIX91566.1 DUF4238 domain-containing protein [Rhizobium sp. P44RR-XXIV]
MNELIERKRQHHYIPKFYSKRWIGKENKLIRWSVARGEIKPEPVHPSGTGYLTDLYTLRGFGDVGPEIESLFFEPVDGHASKALAKMIKFGDSAHWTERLRSAWTVFILSLEMRMPEDLEILRAKWPALMEAWSAQAEGRYSNIRKEADPTTYREYRSLLPPSEDEKLLFDALMKMINNPTLGQFINNMFWDVIDTSAAGIQLLTSDRPIIRSNGIVGDHGHIVIPISPNRIFAASNTIAARATFKSMPITQLINEVNLRVVRSAAKFVYSTDIIHQDLICSNFGIEQQPRQFELSIARFIKELTGSAGK